MKDPRTPHYVGIGILSLVFLSYSGCESERTPSSSTASLPKKYIPLLDPDKERPDRFNPKPF